MIRSLILALLFVFSLHQDIKAINPNIPPPKNIDNTVPLNTQIVDSNQIISVDFMDINYQISYQLYLQNQSLSSSLYTKSAYTKNSPLYDDCFLFPTTINVKTSSTKVLEGLPLQSYNSESTNRFYSILNSGILTLHQYDQKQLKEVNKIKIPDTVIDFKNGGISSGFFTMVQLQRKLYLFDFGKAFVVNAANVDEDDFKSVAGVQNDTSHCSGVYDEKEGTLWVSGKNTIYIYTVQQYSFSLKQSVANFTEQDISAVVMQISQDNHVFYVTTINKLHILILDFHNNIHHEQFSINGTCTQLTIIKDTLYLGCSYNKINYVMELQIQKRVQKQGTIQYQANLNRFYDDRMVEGLRRVQPLGYDKIVLIGEQQSLIIGEAVNRNVLNDLAKNKNTQRSDNTYSFGIIDISNIKKYANSASSTIIVLKASSVQLWYVNQVPPQLWCIFQRSEVGPVVSALIAFNTSHCPYSSNDPTTTGGTNSVCESLYGYQFYIGATQVQKTTAHITIFGIILMLIILTLVCVGWCYQFRKSIDEARHKVMKKINALKNKDKQLKQL